MDAQRSWLGRALKGTASWLLIFALTYVAFELVARFAFDVRPLTRESVVWRKHPRWGWHHEPGAEDVFVKLGIEQPIRINSLGLREREIPYEKPDGVYRILVVGDSSVVSFEVPQEAVFTRVAEDLLRERGHSVEIVNGGCRGWGTDQALLFLQDEGLRYQPDLVIYKWTGNDRSDNVTIHRPFREFGKPWFALGAEGDVGLRGVPVPDYPYTSNLVSDEQGDLVDVPISVREEATLWLRDVWITRSSFATAMVGWAMTLPFREQILQAGSYDDRGVVRTLEHSHELSVALARKMAGVARDAGADYAMVAIHNRGFVPELRRRAGIENLGVWRRFRQSIPEGARVNFRFDPHMNPFGQELYGRALADALEASDLLPPPS